MEPKTISVVSMLCDLKAAATKLMEARHANPALLNWYSFIDICAGLTNEKKTQNRDIFESYLKNYCVLSSWKMFSPYDLWAARSSILHTYSPLGHHTSKKSNSAKPIFYYSWPEKKEEVSNELMSRGYSEFHLISVSTIKSIAIEGFNEILIRLEKEPDLEALFIKNAEDILFNLHYMRLEDELRYINEITNT